MTRPAVFSPVRILVWAALLLPLTACGGGGGGGGPTNPTPPPNQREIVFTPGGSAAADSISLVQTSATTSTTLELDLVANDIDGLYGVAFDLIYPASLLSFVGAEEGTHLSGADGEASTSMQVSDDGGTLIVGLTRLGIVDGVGGTGVLMTLTFTVTGSGSGQLVFDRARAVDSRGATLGDVVFEGGSLRVVL